MAENTTAKADWESELRNELYSAYKACWVKDHISEADMAATKAMYENNVKAKEMSFDEYVESHGFCGGSCYVSFGEFCDNELYDWELANRIELYMFTRGEYDYPESGRAEWIAGAGSERRSTTRENIYRAVCGGADARTALYDYFAGEIAVLDKQDELRPIACRIMVEI